MINQESVIEELTAYLDGELTPKEMARVEQRLADDSDYLAEMQALQKTWDLFEEFPHARASEGFTQSTMEMVVQDAFKQNSRANFRWWKWPARLLLFAVFPALLFCASFFGWRHLQTQPTRDLVENLALIENIDRYEKVRRNLDFLIALEKQSLFAEDASFDLVTDQLLAAEGLKEPLPADGSIAKSVDQNKRRIDALSNEQKSDLERKHNQFRKLDQVNRNELETFQNDLLEHADSQKLIRVMREFDQWLNTLTLTEQAALLDLPTESRLDEIDRIRTRQYREAFGRSGATKLPTSRDAEFLFDWYEVTINSKINQLRSLLVDSMRQQFAGSNQPVPESSLEKVAKKLTTNQLVEALLQRERDALQDIVIEDVGWLRRGLSFEARAIFDEQSVAEQKELVLNWVVSANQTRSNVDQEELQRFYEELPPEERDELDRMAPDNWIQALEAKYRTRYELQRNTRSPFEDPDDWQSFLEANGF